LISNTAIINTVATKMGAASIANIVSIFAVPRADNARERAERGFVPGAFKIQHRPIPDRCKGTEREYLSNARGGIKISLIIQRFKGAFGKKRRSSFAYVAKGGVDVSSFCIATWLVGLRRSLASNSNRLAAISKYGSSPRRRNSPAEFGATHTFKNLGIGGSTSLCYNDEEQPQPMDFG